MKITEIELINDQTFPKEQLGKFLAKSSPRGMLGEFTVNYLENNNQRMFILTDSENRIASFATFRERLNGRVWQSRNAASFAPYQGQSLVGKLYKMIKTDFKKSIQSDNTQTTSGVKLWTQILPSLGLVPMIFDTTTEKIIDPASSTIDMYPKDYDDPEIHRYTWILEKFDNYPEQNLLVEGSLLMPYTGLWYTWASP